MRRLGIGDSPSPTPSRESLTGWGRTSPASCLVHRPDAAADVTGIVAGGPSIARGEGRSYGDAAQNAGGSVIDVRHLDGIVAFDRHNGTIAAQAGVTIDQLLQTIVPHGWFVAVTPGTRRVTIGGAIAADVHGKNHHHDGSFCEHVASMTVDSGDGPRLLTPEATPDEFWATAGGMGLTGVIIEATLRLRPIGTSLIASTTERHGNLDSLMRALEAADSGSTYTVAWLDTLNGGPRLGRGLLIHGEHATLDDLGSSRGQGRPPLHCDARHTVRLPPVAVPALSPGLGRVLNQIWYRANRPGRQLTSIGSFFHPLDAIDNWNLLYGRSGFVQWQVVVPDEAAGFIGHALGQLETIGAGSFLSVLKRFGPGNRAPMSFPMPGWTLAVDIAAGTERLDATLHHLDQQVADLGGRVYLAKDARLHPELLDAMYPEIGRWRAIRDRMDPARHFRSDLSRRLGLTGPRPHTAPPTPAARSLT